MPPGQQRRRALHRLASRWGRSDPQAALRWSEDLTGRDQFATMEDILRHWSDDDPAAAADYLTQLPGSEHTMHLLRDLSHRWAESDRTAALEWSMALENPALRMRAIRGVASSWAENDPAGAANFTTDSLQTVNERHHVLEAVGPPMGRAGPPRRIGVGSRPRSRRPAASHPVRAPACCRAQSLRGGKHLPEYRSRITSEWTNQPRI